MSTDPADDWQNPSRFVPAYYGIAPVRINGRLIGITKPSCRDLYLNLMSRMASSSFQNFWRWKTSAEVSTKCACWMSRLASGYVWRVARVSVTLPCLAKGSFCIRTDICSHCNRGEAQTRVREVPVPARAWISHLWNEGRGNHSPCTGFSNVNQRHITCATFVSSDVQVFDATAQKYWRAGKKFGQSLTPDRVVDGLAVFFSDGKRMREEVILAVLWQLYQLKAWAERQTRCDYPRKTHTKPHT